MRKLARPSYLLLALLVLLVATLACGGEAEPTVVSIAATLNLETDAQPGSTVMKLSPTKTQLAVGETTTVEVQVENVTKLAAVEIRLVYNSTVLEVGSITEGSFFPPVRGTLVKRDMAGVIRYEAEANPPVSGGGTLVSIVFKGRAKGTANLTFSTLFLGNAQGGSISATSQGEEITVGSASE